MCSHDYGWPRKGSDKVDRQTCGRCGGVRVSRIQFDPMPAPEALRAARKMEPERMRAYMKDDEPKVMAAGASC